MTFYAGRTVRFSLSVHARMLFASFYEYQTMRGESYVRATVAKANVDLVRAAERQANYGLMRLAEENATGQIYELTCEGHRAWREVLSGALELTVTMQPERLSVGRPPCARSRRGVEIPEPEAAQEEERPTSHASAMQPQRRLRNSRKKG